MLKIYVISLEIDIERRKLIKSKLDHLEVPFEFLDAVYGKELSDNFISRLHPAGRCLARGFPPTSGEVGCTLSHLKLYKLLQSSEWEWACILEDDAILDKSMYNFFINFDKEVKKLNNQALYLLGGQNGLPGQQLVIKSIFNTLKIGNVRFNKVTYGGEHLARTCCYLMHKRMAKSILDLSRKGFLLADDWEFLQKNNIIQSVYLANFIDHPLDLSISNIEQERQNAEKIHNITVGRKLNASVFYKVKLVLYKVKNYFKFCLIQLYRFKR